MKENEGQVRKTARETGIDRSAISRWGKQEKQLFILPQDKLKSSYYLLLKKDDVRKTGRFPKQQEKVLVDFWKRCADGYGVSTRWLRSRMAFHCRGDLPEGYDPLKYNFGCKWVTSFMTRHHLAIRRKTNKQKNLYFSSSSQNSKLLFLLCI